MVQIHSPRPLFPMIYLDWSPEGSFTAGRKLYGAADTSVRRAIISIPANQFPLRPAPAAAAAAVEGGTRFAARKYPTIFPYSSLL